MLIVTSNSAAAATTNVPASDGRAECSADLQIRSILHDLLELEKFNLRFNLEASRQGRWKAWRYTSLQQANSILTNSGSTVLMSERFQHISNPGDNHVGALMHGMALGGVGQVIGGGASCLELALNGYHLARASRIGLSPGKAKHYAKELIGNLDHKLAQLNLICLDEQPASDTKALHLLEQNLLTDMRNLSVAEFARFHIGARRVLWGQQSFYLLDCAKNTVGALGNLVAYNGLRHSKSNLIAPSGLLTTISGAFIIADPIISRLIGSSVAAYDRFRLNADGMSTAPVRQLQSDTASLQEFCQQHVSGRNADMLPTLTRVVIYEHTSQRFIAQEQQSSNEIRAGARETVQNISAGVLVGSTKCASGITTLLAGLPYKNNPRRANLLMDCGSLAYTVGTGFAVWEQLRIQLTGQSQYCRLKANKRLPAQLVNTRIEELEQMQKSLESL